jgi:alanyl-tRNA synthetase
VLRKIIRRALRHAHILDAPTPFLSLMSAAVRAGMKEAYPELEEHAARVTKILDEEESRFTRTIEVGLRKFDEDLRRIVSALHEQHKDKLRFTNAAIGAIANQATDRIVEQLASGTGKHVQEALSLMITRLKHVAGISEIEFPGENAFRLYDTFGLPRDFIEDVARDAGVTVNWSRFDGRTAHARTRIVERRS